MTSVTSNYVRFDVGHYLHVCHKNTLQKFQDSLLAKLVEPHNDSRKCDTDYIVIDRDGKHFGTILNYMRDSSSLQLEGWTDAELTNLMREADFYCLELLVEHCEREFEYRESKNNKDKMEKGDRAYVIPADKKLEIIYGLNVMLGLLSTSKVPVIVINHKSIRRFHIDSWIEDLMSLCDHEKFKVYSFSAKTGESCGYGLSDFIMSLYDPEEKRFPLTLSAPSDEKFRTRRGHYKSKTYKFWFLVQNRSFQRYKSIH